MRLSEFNNTPLTPAQDTVEKSGKAMAEIDLATELLKLKKARIEKEIEQIKAQMKKSALGPPAGASVKYNGNNWAGRDAMGNPIAGGPVDEARRKKSKKKKTRFAYGGYFYPGYSFFGGGSDSGGDAGGDGGGFEDYAHNGQLPSVKRQAIDSTYNVDEARIIDADTLIDIYLRGKHGGKTISKLIASNFPNQHLEALVQKLVQKYKINPSAVVYGPSKKVDENFADGKKPGRKGLAKRVGVNCKQPVSKLRSIAKNSSGEKQRMAHWCANMKSGKKRKVPEQDQYPQSDQTQPTQPAPPPEQPQQGGTVKDALGAIQTIGRAVNTYKDQDVGAMVKDELIQMLKRKLRGEGY
jgi:hypothetical protein